MTLQDFARIHALAFPDTRSWDAAEFDALLTSKHCFHIGDSRGFAIGRVIAGESELLTIAVAPEFQGQGFGRRLLDAYHLKAGEMGAETFLLEVSRDNAPAIGLYESTGYITSSVRPDYYKRLDGSTVDALIMTCKVTEKD